jgi:hypothetical protein
VAQTVACGTARELKFRTAGRLHSELARESRETMEMQTEK